MVSHSLFYSRIEGMLTFMWLQDEQIYVRPNRLVNYMQEETMNNKKDNTKTWGYRLAGSTMSGRETNDDHVMVTIAHIVTWIFYFWTVCDMSSHLSPLP